MHRYKNILKNRADAALKLQEIIPLQEMREEKWELVATSKGGLKLASFLSERSHNNLEALCMAAITAPQNPDCEIARVSETEEIVINEELVSAFEIQYDYIYGEAHRKHEEDILSYIYQYRKGQPFPSMQDKIVMLVDDGCETGSRMLTALKTVLAQQPKAIYIAVPVLPKDVLEQLEPFVDKIFFLYDIDDFVNTAHYYEAFDRVEDEMIEKLLEENE